MRKIKMHQLPGDIGLSMKIAMMEKKFPEAERRAKAFRKMIRDRWRAVLKERTMQEIRNAG